MLKFLESSFVDEADNELLHFFRVVLSHEQSLDDLESVDHLMHVRAVKDTFPVVLLSLLGLLGNLLDSFKENRVRDVVVQSLRSSLTNFATKLIQLHECLELLLVFRHSEPWHLLWRFSDLEDVIVVSVDW